MKGSALVVGAGIAGMRATSELVQQGFKVYLLEEQPTIGGKVVQIDKMFPTNECATCTTLPKMLDLTNNPNITILAFADLLSTEGAVGDFKVKVLKKPRYVDPMKCTACTDCFPACPVGGIPMEFNFGRGVSKAISFYSPFPPRKALINPDKCSYITDGKCGDTEVPPCVAACKPEAINFSQKSQEAELHVGAIILATGVDEDKGEVLKRFGYGDLPNVLTALEYERLLSGLGPTAGMVKRDDGKEPESVAWLVLDESSTIGFMSAAAEAMGTIERNPNVRVSILYKSIGQLENSLNRFYLESKERGVRYVHTASAEIEPGTDGSVTIRHDKEGGKESLEVDMLILAAPLVPSPGTHEVGRRLGIDLDERGIFKKIPGDFHPLHTSRDGILVCGSAQGPKGISDSIIQACAAATEVSALLAPARDTELVTPPQKDFLPVSSEDEPEVAVVICRCGMNIAGLLNIDELAEYTASLPHVKHVELTPFGCDGVKVRELLKTGEFNRLVVGACSPKTHEPLFQQHTEAGGINRYLMEIVNLRNQCTWVHSKDKEAATKKAKALMKMGISRAALHVPLEEISIPVTQSCLVVGCTPAGIGCAAKLAEMGLPVHLVDAQQVENTDTLITKMLGQLQESDKVKVYENAKIGKGSGFIGNYNVEIVEPNRKTSVDVGSIVIATIENMKANDTDYEADLTLKRDETGLFTGALGIMNPVDFNTEGIFKCGSARSPISKNEGLVDGEAAASRAAGIILKDKMAKAPTLSLVVDENCDGCAYCIEPCPAQAITLLEYKYSGSIKKTVEVNEAMCKGCGICMATCPKDGIIVRHFKPEYFRVMIKAALEVS
ncbi:4Fe-4S dicluster domain-containing protein [Chloroflexota bacterium]